MIWLMRENWLFTFMITQVWLEHRLLHLLTCVSLSELEHMRIFLRHLDWLNSIIMLVLLILIFFRKHWKSTKFSKKSKDKSNKAQMTKTPMTTCITWSTEEHTVRPIWKTKRSKKSRTISSASINLLQFHSMETFTTILSTERSRD